MFISFESIRNGEKLNIENSTTFDIKGQGKLIVKMTSRKKMNLNNVFACAKNSQESRI